MNQRGEADAQRHVMNKRSEAAGSSFSMRSTFSDIPPIAHEGAERLETIVSPELAKVREHLERAISGRGSLLYLTGRVSTSTARSIHQRVTAVETGPGIAPRNSGRHAQSRDRVQREPWFAGRASGLPGSVVLRRSGTPNLKLSSGQH